MKKFFGVLAAVVSFSICQLASADLVVIGFNADGTDGFSLMATNSIASGSTYWLTDREWDAATGSFNTGEGLISIAFGQGVSQGTILNVNAIDDSPNVPTITDGFGASVATTFSGDVSTGLSSSGEGLYLFLDSVTGDGSTVSTQIASFIAGNGGGDPFAFGNSINFAGTSLDAVDVMAYAGPTSGLASFSDYVTLLQDPTNWANQGDGAGDQSADYAPATGRFTITAIPEPSTYGVLTVLGLAGIAYRRRK